MRAFRITEAIRFPGQIYSSDWRHLLDHRRLLLYLLLLALPLFVGRLLFVELALIS
jgi:hypothetical protein